MDKEEKSAEVSCPRSESTRDIKLPVLPKPLSLDEKKYLLAVERGDLTTVKR
jgi:transient-receptor-potential-like protein